MCRTNTLFQQYNLHKSQKIHIFQNQEFNGFIRYHKFYTIQQISYWLSISKLLRLISYQILPIKKNNPKNADINMTQKNPILKITKLLLNLLNQLQTKMHKLTIEELKQHHIEDTTQVIARSFLELNDIWKGYQPTYQEIYPIIRSKVIPAACWGWSFVLLKNNKIIGASIQLEMIDYLKLPSLRHQSKLFTTLGKYAKKLESVLQDVEWKRGESSFGLYGVIDPSQSNQGYSLKFWWTLFAMGKVSGWKNYYTRASNPQSYRMLMKLGGELVNEIQINEDEVSHKKLWLVKIDLTRDFPTFSMLQSLARAKL